MFLTLDAFGFGGNTHSQQLPYSRQRDTKARGKNKERKSINFSHTDACPLHVARTTASVLH